VTRGRSAALALLLVAAATPAVAEIPVPALTGPVVDKAGVLDARWAKRLDELSRAARSQGGGAGPQLQYLLVPTLDGEPIESYSMRVAEKWKLGTKGKDDGVLVVVAVKDRRVRIEVGGGLEGGLTDAQSGRIIRSSITPAFKEGRYGEGLYAGGQQILASLGALPEGMKQAPRRPPPGKEVDIPIVGTLLGFLFGMGAPFLVLMIIFFVIVRALAGFGRRGPRGPWGGGGFGGGFGGGGGFSGGGGGWSGGGGGFSGGGASGSW
jgi:uncharacterized protein